MEGKGCYVRSASTVTMTTGKVQGARTLYNQDDYELIYEKKNRGTVPNG